MEALVQSIGLYGWVDDGMPIRFATGGRLLDGQHRLSAIVKAKITVDLVTVTDLDEKAFAVMDTGSKRFTSDALHMAGHVNTTRLAATCRMLVQLRMVSEDLSMPSALSEFTDNQQVLSLLTEFPELPEHVCKAMALSKHFPPLNKAFISTSVFLTYKEDPELAEKFWEAVALGANLTTTSPAYQLRQRLLSLFSNTSSNRYIDVERLRLVFHAWSCFKKGREVKILRAAPESAPIPFFSTKR